MKIRDLVGALLLAACAGAVFAGDAFDESELGLSKTSVFDVPTPQAFGYAILDPEDADALPRAFPGAPPQIPHEIESMLPVSTEANECMDCHDKPRYIGRESSTRSPMPESHYRDTGLEQQEWQMAGLRFNCTLCHVPQAEVMPLVENNFAE